MSAHACESWNRWSKNSSVSCWISVTSSPVQDAEDLLGFSVLRLWRWGEWAPSFEWWQPGRRCDASRANMAAECTDEPLLLLGTDSFFCFGTGAQYFFFFFFWTSFLNFPLKLWNFPEIWRAGSHAGWCWHLTLHVCASSADTFHRLLSTPASDCFTATVLPLLTPPSSPSSSSDGEVDSLTCSPGFVLWWSSFPLSYSWLFSFICACLRLYSVFLVLFLHFK